MMVLPAAIGLRRQRSAARAADSDDADAIVGRFQREMWNILISPDVKLVKTR